MATIQMTDAELDAVAGGDKGREGGGTGGVRG